MSEFDEQRRDVDISRPFLLEQRIISRLMTDGSRARRGVTVNIWRIFNTLLIIALGIWKTVAALQGETIAPTILDWALGVIWAIVSYWVSAFEAESPESCSWLLKHNPRLANAAWFVVVNTSKVFALLVVYSIQWLGEP
uniref:Uncharacterized protein n=1 Tax=Psilocybe cubensis TaxID=181762 RepID=A0A8H7XJ18_PSICU